MTRGPPTRRPSRARRRWEVAHHADAVRAAGIAQGVELREEEILLDAIALNDRRELRAIAGEGRRVARCGALLPCSPRGAAVYILERHEQCVVLQPGTLLGDERPVLLIGLEVPCGAAQ